MRLVQQLVCAFLLACVSPSLLAKWIESGEKISLSPNEGLALFVVDSDGSLTNIRIDRIGSIFSAPVLKDLRNGRQLRLLALEQGDYQLDKAQLYWGWMTYQWDMKELPNRTFHVDAGKINYIGDLKIEGSGLWRQMSIRNSGLRVFDELESQFPGLRDRYNWRYAGEFPDPFIDFYKQRMAGHPDATTLGDPEVPRPTFQEKELASLLFRDSPIQDEALAPSGRYVLELRHEGNVSNVYALNLSTHANRLLLSSRSAPNSVTWLADDLLAIDYLKGGIRKTGLFQFKDDGQVVFAEIPAAGWIYSAGTSGGAGAIFVRKTEDGAGLELFQIDRIDLDLVRGLTDRVVGKYTPIHSEIRNDYEWWFDSASVPRLALYADNGKAAYEYFAPGGGSGVKFTLDEDNDNPNDQFAIAGFDRDGKLLAISNRGRTQADMVEFDPLTHKEGATRFARAGVDVIDAMRGLNGEVVGVLIKSGGRVHQEPFASTEVSLQQALESALPGRSVGFGAARRNANRLVFSHGPKDPGSYYIFNETSKKLDLLALSAEQLEDRPLLDTHRFEVRSHDGFAIEAFLTLPVAATQAGKPPLLVMPHGGPIGAFDTERFDPEVQYFSQLGFAVVQVNYRGSGGGGTAMVNLGIGQYGRAIENDVDEVVDSLVASGKVDPDRIVAMGTSYGGYSSLMLTLERPKRYKAAVSIAGVTDVLAQFSGGDITLDKKIAELLVKIIGDPRQNADALKAISPVYRYAELNQPIMLVHDRGDERVTPDQSERLRRMLMFKGTPATTIFVQDNVHGLAVASTAMDVYPKIAAFLFQALAKLDNAAATPIAH